MLYMMFEFYRAHLSLFLYLGQHFGQLEGVAGCLVLIFGFPAVFFGLD